METDIFDKSMGNLGRYQTWLTFLIFLTKFPVGWHLLNIIIIAPKPKVTCMMPSNITSGCDPSCKSRRVDPTPFDRTIHSQWNLVCESAYLATLSQMLMMAGVMLGSFIAGMWADRQGRKIPLVVFCLLQAIAATAIAYVPWLPLFLILRFVTGLATGGQMTSSFVLLMELVGKKWRVKVGTVYQIPTWFAHLSLSLIGYLCRDWRVSQIVVGVPSFIFISYIWLVPESPRYLVSSGDTEKAVRVVEKIARKNKMDTQDIAKNISAYAEQLKMKMVEKGKLSHLFKPKQICFRTLILVLHWIAVGVCFYGVAQYAGQAKGNVFVNIAMSAAMEIPGTLLALIFVDKIGRKWTTIVTCLFSGLPMLVIPFLNEDTAAIPIMALIALFGLAALFATVYVYSGELYPTFIRSIGVGFVSMTCRIGTVTAPFIATLGDMNMPWLPPIIFGVFPLISGAMTLFLPETKYDQLADTLEDALNLGKKKQAAGDQEASKAK